MKKYVNGKYIEMTPTEIEELKKQAPAITEEITDNTEKRLAQIEKVLEKFGAFFDRLGVK